MRQREAERDRNNRDIQLEEESGIDKQKRQDEELRKRSEGRRSAVHC